MSTLERLPDGRIGLAATRRLSWRQIVGALRWAWLRVIAVAGGLSRRWRVVREQQAGRVVTSEVLISHPDPAWDPSAALLAEQVSDPKGSTPRRWNVSAAEVLVPQRGDEAELTKRRFVRVTCKPGLEREVIRAVKLASWRDGLRVGRGGLLAVRSAIVVPATADVPIGSIEFSNEFKLMKTRCGVGFERRADEVTVVVLDVDVPDRDVLSKRGVHLASVTGSTTVGGHSTMVTAIIGDIAPNATLHAVGIGGTSGTASSWGLMNAIEHHADADIIVAALTLVDSGGSPEEDERTDFVDCYLRRVTSGNVNLPLLVFPTGNHLHDVEHTCDIGVPGRSEAAVTIGAIESSGTRALGSRYGRKLGSDPERWWVAPGGSFGGTQPATGLLSIGGDPSFGFGTSVATAFAGGVIAVALGLQRSTATMGDPNSNVYSQALREKSPDDPAVPLLRQLSIQAAGQASPTVLLRKLEQMADKSSLLNYRGNLYGKGLIRITDALTERGRRGGTPVRNGDHQPPTHSTGAIMSRTVDHFPPQIEALAAFAGPFDAYRLAADGCDVLFASYAAGTTIAAHHHDTDNVGVITKGSLMLTINETPEVFTIGQWYHVPAGVEHEARFDVDSAEIEFWFTR